MYDIEFKRADLKRAVPLALAIVFNTAPVWLLGVGLSPSSAAGQEVVLSETFEDPATADDWFSDFGVWEVGTPTSGPDSAYGGTKCAGTVLAGNYPFGPDSRFMSPRIDLAQISGDEEIVLRYWQHFNWAPSSDNGRVQVQVYDFDSSTWSDWTTLATFTLHTPVWHRARVDLTVSGLLPQEHS
jgi:bacillopeptidase F